MRLPDLVRSISARAATTSSRPARQFRMKVPTRLADVFTCRGRQPTSLNVLLDRAFSRAVLRTRGARNALAVETGADLVTGPRRSDYLDESRTQHVNFYRYMSYSTSLSGSDVIEPLEPDDAAVVIFHQYHVVADLLADGLEFRIVEPDGYGIANSIEVDPHLLHKAFPS
jgi:hypothetical protein